MFYLPVYLPPNSDSYNPFRNWDALNCWSHLINWWYIRNFGFLEKNIQISHKNLLGFIQADLQCFVVGLIQADLQYYVVEIIQADLQRFVVGFIEADLQCFVIKGTLMQIWKFCNIFVFI